MGRVSIIQCSYDTVGRPLSILDPNGKTTSYSYDPLGRVLTVTLPQIGARTFVTHYSYDNFDSATSLVFTHITDPNGKLTKLGYDEQGRLRKSIDAANGETLYAYTNDVLTAITDPNGNVTSYHYDALKRLDRTTFPDGATETYSYRADGLLQSKTDRKGQTITYAYDAFKRLTTKTYPDGKAITYTYAGQKLVSVLDETKTPSETHSFGYDHSYRVSSNTQGPRGTLSYTYTPDDRVATMGVTSGPSQTYTYYPDGSLDTIAWSVVGSSFKYTYTPAGQYQEISFPNGQHRDYSYDDQGRLLTLSNTLGATTLASFAYGYDHDWTSGTDTMLGQRTSMTATVPAQSLNAAQSKYSYDPLYQLVKAQYPAGAPFNGETHEWTYDALGNRLSSKVNGTGPSYTYLKNGTNPLNGQRLSSDGQNSYAYDPNGSQTARTGAASYAFGYDVDNRLSSISGAATASYTYDYQGRRISKTEAGVTTTYLYDGLNPIAETVSGAPKYVLNGPSIDEPLAVSTSGTISYLNADGLGSILATNNAAGTVSHSLSFDAWGLPRNETGTRAHGFTFTGREVGVAGMHFYRARFLQPGVGRFSQEDPLRPDRALAHYGYVQNDPADFGDPTGLVRVKIGGRIYDVHANDLDTNHPSGTPHAHIYDENVRVNLTTGEIYAGKRVVGNIGAKALAKLRCAVKKAGLLGTVLTIGITAQELYAAIESEGGFGASSRRTASRLAGGIAGAWAGGTAGAALGFWIGSVIPGAGNGVGGTLGFAFGFVGGMMGSSLGEDAGQFYVEVLE